MNIGDPQIFSTDAFAPEHRYDVWRGLIGVTHDIDADPVGFQARVATTTIDRVIVRQFTCPPQAAARSARRVHADGLDHVLLHFTTHPMVLEVAGRHIAVPAGSLAVNSLTEPFRRNRCAEQGSLLVHLSRDLVTEALPDPERLHGQFIPEAHDTLLGAHILSLARQAAKSPADGAGAIARATALLLAATLAPSRRTLGEARDSLQNALKMQCKRYIQLQLRAPDLSPQTICKNVGLSRSTLYRLFAVDGGVSDYIRQRRLSTAMAALTNGHAPRLSHLSNELGFSDQAAFSRAFKAAFGCSPSDVLHQRETLPTTGGDDAFREWLRSVR